MPSLPDAAPSGSRKIAAAFTLVELLVAMVVSLLLVFVLLRVFTTATTSWQRGEAQADAYREARGALQLMARDLSTIVQPLSTQVTGATNYRQPQLPTLVISHYSDHLAPDPAPKYAEETSLNEEVYCLTNIINSATPSKATPSPGGSPTPAPGMPSETCSVGYFCQWMPSIAALNTQNGQTDTSDHAPRAFALMRQFLNSDGVFQRLKTVPATTSPLNYGVLYTRNSLLPTVAPVIDPPAATSTQLAAYVWDLKFRIDTNLPDKPDGTALYVAADHGDPAAADPTHKPRYYDGTSAPYPGVLPPYVEIRFKALSTGAGRRLEGPVHYQGSTDLEPKVWADPTSPAYRSLILPNARQFVLRVPLINSNPLPQP